MELKRIIARDTRSANEKAIALYGPDVLIISMQKVEGQTELIVAVDVEPVEAKSAPSPLASPAGEAMRPVPPAEGAAVIHPAGSPGSFARALEVAMVPGAASLNTASAETPTDTLSALSRRVQVEIPAENPAAPVRQQTQDTRDEPAAAAPLRVSRRAREDVSDLVSGWASRQVQSIDDQHDLHRSQETVELLRQEMAALRQEFMLSRKLMMYQGGQGLSPQVESVLAQLMDLGVPAALRTLFIDSLTECATASEARQTVADLLIGSLDRPAADAPVNGVHVLCGPSGSGKTMMVARLALALSRQNPEHRQAIISFSDAKSGAWSQLQVLAAQAGVDCYRAADESALEVLLQDLSDRHTVWIDTQGNDFMAQARRLQGQDLSVHAVLPVDAAWASVHKVLGARDVHWSSLLLTKMDEASHPWPLIKGLCESRLPVAGLCASNQPTQAMAMFDAAQLVELALAPLQTQELPPAKTRPERAQTAVPVKSEIKPARSRARPSHKALNG
jgi:flagellar biosynthesis protein FlhF